MKSKPKSNQLPVRRIPVHELFPQPMEIARRPPARPAAPAPMKIRMSSVAFKRRFPAKNILLALVFLGTILSGFGLFGYWRRGSKQTPYVLLEVRALEESGHPVTAATVMVNKKAMGVTDSFGEWRRYLQLAAGEKVEVSLDKKGELSGSKQVEVPRRPANKQDIEVEVAIAMTSPKAVARAAAKAEPALNEKNDREVAAFDNEAEPVKVAEPAPKVLPRLIKKVTEAAHREAAAVASDLGTADTNDSSLGIYFDDGLSSIHVMSSPHQSKPTNLMDKRQQEVVHDRVLPVLANDLQNLGLKLDLNSPWKLALSYIPNGEQVGYIRADIEWHSPFGQTEKSSFVAGFEKTYEETGRILSNLLRLHMKKTYWAFKDNGNWYIDENQQTKDFWRLKAGSFVTDTSGEKFDIALAGEGENGRRWKMRLGRKQPCESVRQRSRCMVSTESPKEAPPLPGWALKKVRILGPVPQGTDVFVGGFQAKPVGNQQWEFWSRPGSSLRAIVLANNRIIHSEAFQDTPGEAVLMRIATAAPQANARNRAH